MVDEVPTVRMKHIRAAQFCAGGARRWFRDSGLDWDDFLVNGITVAKLEELGDPMGLRVGAIAQKEFDNG